jgi:hypothetical protein
MGDSRKQQHTISSMISTKSCQQKCQITSTYFLASYHQLHPTLLQEWAETKLHTVYLLFNSHSTCTGNCKFQYYHMNANVNAIKYTASMVTIPFIVQNITKVAHTTWLPTNSLKHLHLYSLLQTSFSNNKSWQRNTATSPNWPYCTSLRCIL